MNRKCFISFIFTIAVSFIFASCGDYKTKPLSGSVLANGEYRGEEEMTDSSAELGSPIPENMVFIDDGTFTTPAQYREMVQINGATITGSGSTGVFIADRTVTLNDFKIGKYEVTYQLWKEVCAWAYQNDYHFANYGTEGHGEDGTGSVGTETERMTRPVTYINWRDAMVWCNAYSEMSGKQPVYYATTSAGISVILRWSPNNRHYTTDIDFPYPDLRANGYRLPTEAEWEYVARGGNQSNTSNWNYSYSGSNTIDDVAWYDGNSSSLGKSNAAYGVHPVGTRQPNSLGLYDMNGNVDEWCWDWYGDIVTGAADNPINDHDRSYNSRVLRGGSWDDAASSCTVATRSYYHPSEGSFLVGFRVVCK